MHPASDRKPCNRVFDMPMRKESGLAGPLHMLIHLNGKPTQYTSEITAATRDNPERPPGTMQTFSYVYWLAFPFR